MRLMLTVILLLSAAVSCKKEKQPEGILSREQMVDWMISIYIAEARAQQLPNIHDSAYRVFLPFQDSLMRAKGLHDSTLSRSYRYYLEDPTRMEALYDTVIDSLSLREQRLLPGPRVPSQ